MVTAALALAGIVVWAATTQAAGAIAPGTAIAAARGVLSAPAGEPAAAVRAYWTASRMRAARPADLVLDAAGNLRRATPAEAPSARSAPAAHSRTAVDSSGDNTEYPGRVHGKVFFTIPGGSQPGDFVCSATVVTSGGHTLVWTAGHCVVDSEFGGGFATNWAFVPGYRDGQRPYGTWPAQRLFTTEAWGEDADSRQDLGAARLARDGDGHGIEDVVGAREISFSRPRPTDLVAYGYPAEPTLFHLDFDGEHLFGCASPITGRDNPPGPGPPTLQIDCDMTGGSSGGGWVTAEGAINGVTSYGYAGDLEHLYGPYLGTEASDLYGRASAGAALCAGAEVTNLGSGSRDDFIGGARRDALKLGAGRDSARGLDAGDAACGGGGRDRLDGGPGNDRLRGGGGPDVLIGGDGFDVCVGGPGHDRARGCERRRQIP